MVEKNKKATSKGGAVKQRLSARPQNWQKGQSGNPKGRPPRPEIQQLREAIERVQKKKKVDLLEHMVERAYEDNKVLIALAKKIVPDLSTVSGDLNIRQRIIKCIGLEQLEPEK